MLENKHKGSTFESFLQEEGIVIDKRTVAEGLQLIILKNALLNSILVTKSIQLLPESREQQTVLDRLKYTRKLMKAIKVNKKWLGE